MFGPLASHINVDTIQNIFITFSISKYILSEGILDSLDNIRAPNIKLSRSELGTFSQYRHPPQHGTDALRIFSKPILPHRSTFFARTWGVS